MTPESSTTLITNDIVGLGLIAATLALVFHLSSKSEGFWKKFSAIIPALLLCYFIPALYNTFGILDGHATKLYNPVARDVLLPAALVLLTLSIDLKGILRLGPKLLLMFATGTFGIMLGAVVGSVSTFVALQTDMLQNLGVWFAGSFTSVLRGQYEVLWIVAAVVVVVFIVADRLTAAGLGEDIATSIGLNYSRIILFGTILIAIATGVVTVVVGNLPFLGLIVPNIVSMIRGDDLRSNLTYIAPTMVNLNLTQERYPDVVFRKTREH